MSSKLVEVPADLQEELESYYDEEVSTKKKEKEANHEFVDDIVADILEYINSKDGRFSTEPIMYGSFCHKLSLKHADEFRYGVRLLVPESSQWTTPHLSPYQLRTYSFDKQPAGDLDYSGRPLAYGRAMKKIPKDLKVVQTSTPLPAPKNGYGSLQIGKNNAKWKNLVVNGDVIPFLVKQHLQNLLMQAITGLDLQDMMTISKTVTGSYLTCTVIRGSRALRVDLAVMVEKKLPFSPWIVWPRAQAKWPDNAKVAKVKQQGMNLRATGQFYWRESFSEARTELIKNIDKDGGVRRKVFCIVKTLNNDYWGDDTKDNQPVVSSLEIKNLWLWLIEAKSTSLLWGSDQLAIRVMELASLIKTRCEMVPAILPHYFDQSRNMFAEKDTSALQRTAAKIQLFLKNPSEFVGEE